MCGQSEFEDRSYDAIYNEFELPSMRKVRLEAHGKDIGQHSWVTTAELEEDIPRLRLNRASRLLDLGCGACGPLVFTLGLVGCHASGVDLSTKAIAAARARVAASGLEELVTLHEADLNEPMPFNSGIFDAVMSLDVIVHLRDRALVFREVARILVPGGRFLFTDAGVITGPISDDEIRRRAFYGYTQFCPLGFNERMLELAGLRLVECIDRTGNLLKNSTGRLRARLNHRADLEQLEGNDCFERQQGYLETVVGLSQRGVMSRLMYLAESSTSTD
jgi:SAM-dependent methyltransferase